MRNWFRAATLAVGLSVVLPAWAVSSASVTIGQPIITVTDLDATDGITASYQFGGPPIWEFQFELGTVRHDHRLIEGDAEISEVTLGLAGEARGPGARFVGIAERWMPGDSMIATPNTRITVQMSYSFAGMVDGADLGGPELPRSVASLELGMMAINDLEVDPDSGLLAGYYLDYREFTTAMLETRAGSPMRVSGPTQGELTLTFDNLSATDTIFSIRAVMAVTGFANDPLAPVPEPSQWAMALAGLGMVAALARRRRAAVSSRN